MTTDDHAARYLVRPSDAAAPWAGVSPAARAAIGVEDVRTAFQRRPQQPSTAGPEQLRPALVRGLEAAGEGRTTVVNVLTDPGVAYPRRSNLA